MTGKAYRAAWGEVTYDAGRCIHAAECVRGLPMVFDAKRRPWIDPTQAGADAVAEVIERCPTGALHFARQDGGAAETVPVENTVTVAAGGPLYLRGEVEVLAPDGSLLLADTRVALCRCGGSERKPFCDGAHAREGFVDPGVWTEVRFQPGEAGARGPLQATGLPAGPLLLQGPFRLLAADGEESAPAGQAAACRCGASGTKPFCDGSHARIGFAG